MFSQAGKPCYIWSNLDRGPIMYRIVGPEKTGDWKPMEKHIATEDRKVIPQPEGRFCAVEVLERGDYEVEFRVGTQEFSAVRLEVT